jgi:hypothetical protein
MNNDVVKNIQEFIGGYKAGIVSFLSTVNEYERSTIRQVSTFVDFEKNWQVGTIGRHRDGDLKLKHLTKNPKATMHWVETNGNTIGPRWAVRNVWLHADVEIIKDEDIINQFLKKRLQAREQDHTSLEKSYERYLILLHPVRLRAEGFAEFYREVLLINDFVNPTIRKANYRKGVMGSEEKA